MASPRWSAAVSLVAALAAAALTAPAAGLPHVSRQLTRPSGEATTLSNAGEVVAPLAEASTARTAAESTLIGSLASSGITPVALGGGNWQCGHSSGDGKGCFLTTAKYLGKVVGKCAPCILDQTGSDDIVITPPIHDKPVTIVKADAGKCPACVKQVADTPKCGGTFLGIGSKRKGRSCRLVKATGCWPTTTDEVLHDCGPGAECAFKITDAKAKIWCCRPKTKKFFKRWRNLFRCGSEALSKSKDRDGAVVLWE
eukprot:TRINITY_DN1054_c0_g1_i2.p2 TRINITY_DN1054_c0_g1~~TRINITY_DN1054_c0_g1_i2.p2  ORF type:complete len:255 (-),score=65.15 TRINITY_DN1054_c0_g1_i2:292-1056(-)